MDTLLGQSETLRTSSAIAARVLVDAKRAFSTAVDEAFLELWARQAVEELWTETIKVKNFVPVLALRRIREAVEAQQATGATVGINA